VFCAHKSLGDSGLIRTEPYWALGQSETCFVFVLFLMMTIFVIIIFVFDVIFFLE